MDRSVRARGGSERGGMIGREMMTGIREIQGTTKIGVGGLTEGGTSTVDIAAGGIRIMTGVVIMNKIGSVIMIKIEIGGIDIGRLRLQGKKIGRDLPVLVQRASAQVGLTWHHQLGQYYLLLLLQAMLSWRDYIDWCSRENQCNKLLDLLLLRLIQLPFGRLTDVSLPSAMMEFVSYLIISRINNAGQLSGIPQTMPGVVQNVMPYGTAYPTLPMMPAQAMTQQATRHARRVYVGGLPPLANEQTIATFFSQVMAAIGGNSIGSVSDLAGDAVVNVYINHEKKFAFVEMRTVEEASNAMALDGIIFEGVAVRVRRPTDYNPTLAAALGPNQPSSHLNLAAVGLTQGAVGGAEGPDRIFVGGLPYYFTEAQIRELLQSFGPLRGFDLVKDKDTGNSKGYGFCVYQDPAVTDIACGALNGLKMGDKTLTVRRATANSVQSKSEQENILVQAQQHIAMQKMAMQVVDMNSFGNAMASATTEMPTKVLCLTEAITADQLGDEEEYVEILEDMKDECSKFGTLVNVVIPRSSQDGEEISGVGKVFLEYSDTGGCANAKNVLGGRKFGGNIVHAYYYPEDKYLSKDYSA